MIEFVKKKYKINAMYEKKTIFQHLNQGAYATHNRRFCLYPQVISHNTFFIY